MDIRIIVPYVLLAFGILFTAIYVSEKLKNFSIKALLLKATCSMLFLGVAFSAATLHRTGMYANLIIIGLVFGILGDIWLDLKLVYPNDDKIYTYSGFSVFGIGHIFFLTAIVYRYASFTQPWYLIAPVIIAAILGAAIVAVGPLMKLDYGEFKGITRVYAFLLSLLALLTGSLAIMYRFVLLPINLLFIGAVLFLLSDLVLSGTYFGGKDRKVDIILNYIFYYGAQFVIAMSLLFA